MRVGLWPGQSRGGNPFIDLFADGLRGAGADVVDVCSAAAVERGSIDLLHIHWPEQVLWAGGGARKTLWRLYRTIRRLRRLKRERVIIVWMVHNLEPHSMRWKQRCLWLVYRVFLCRLVDGFMTLSPGTVEVVRKSLAGLRDKPSGFAWMPMYGPIAPDAERSEVRLRYGAYPGSWLCGFLGLLRPYKGIDALIEAFAHVPDVGARLVIAGEPKDHRYVDRLSLLAARDPRVIIVARKLSEAEYAGIQAAVDLTVLPFRQSLHSSSLVYAVGAQSPVVTPTSPFADALGQKVGPGWIREYAGPLRPEHLLPRARPPHAPETGEFSKESAGREALAFYVRLRALMAR